MTVFTFFIIVVLTITLSRVALLIVGKHKPVIKGYHHYMLGLVLITLYFFIPYLIILAVGIGLFIDELPLFFIFRGFNWPVDHWNEYFSWKSTIWIVIICIVGYMLTVFLL